MLSRSKEIYHSSSGSLDCHVDLEFVEGGISERCSKLKDSLTSSDNIGESPNEDQTVLAICERSIKISNELRQALESVRIKGPKTKWKSVRKALKSFYKKEEIAELNQRLSGPRTEMNSHITVKIQCRIDFVALKESEHFAKLEVGVQTLVNNVLQSHYDLSNQLNEHEQNINSKIRSEGEAAQDWATLLSVVTLSAIEDSNSAYSMPLVQTSQTPLIFAVQQLAFLPRVSDTAIVRRTPQVSSCSPLNQRYQDLIEIIDILVDGGANLQCRDNAGLSAYDHARILGLDDTMVLKLKPINPYDGKTIAMPRPTHPPHLLMREPESDPLPWSSRPVFIELQRLRICRPIMGRVQA